MKIGKKIIQPRNIKEHTKTDFLAYYKGKEICISTDHGHGTPETKGHKRFLIFVVDLKTGLLDVDTTHDCPRIKGAIKFALKGACLV